MSCSHALGGVFRATTKALRKLNRPRRFNRVRAAGPLRRRMRDYWRQGNVELFGYMARVGGWERIQQHVQLASVGASVEKALSDADRNLIAQILVEFGYFDDVNAQARVIMEATSLPTFEAAAKLALANLGIRGAAFDLKNEKIKELLLARSAAAVFASRNHIEQVMNTIVGHFYELGKNPYDADFIAELRANLNYKSDWEARRFALTETGIASEMAQAETYRRNGVTRKRWSILGRNTRPTHQILDGVEVPITEPFNVGGHDADHPLDPSLPPEELVNCHCWMSPVVNDDYGLDPDAVWEGE